MNTAPTPSNQHTVTDHAAIEQKVTSILQFTKNFAYAASKKDEEDKIVSLLHFAEHFADNGNFDSALFHIKQAYKLRIDDPRIPQVESKIKSMMGGGHSSTQPLTEPSVTNNPHDHSDRVLALVTEAEIYFEKEQYEKTSDLLEQAFALDPLNESLYAFNEKLLRQLTMQKNPLQLLLNNARLQRTRYRFSDALQTLKEAYMLDPLNDEIRELEVQTAGEIHELHQAVQTHILTARKYIGVQRFAEAQQEIRTAYLVFPLDERIRGVEQQLRNVE